MSTVTDKRVLVTGGASGMAAAVAADLAAHGALVVLTDINEEGGEKNAAEARAAGGSAHFLACDVTNPSSVDRAVTATAEHLGGSIDALVHAAGISPALPAATSDLEFWNTVMAVNATGTYLMNCAVLPYLRSPGGRIINFGSSAGVLGYPGKAQYAAAKGAVIAWTRSIAKEWGDRGITANIIAPAIATPMYAKTRASMTPEQLAEHDKEIAQRMAVGAKLGDPTRDLAPVIRFLVSDDSGFITGQTIAVDGGILMMR